MVQSNKAQVIGLVINTGSQQTQVQKAFSLMNVTPVPDVDVADGRDVSAEEEKQLTKELTKRSSIFMNPEIVSGLLGRVTQKDQLARSDPR